MTTALESVTLRFERGGMRLWLTMGFLLQLFLLILFEGILTLLPRERSEAPQLSMVTELKFIEYQETQTRPVAETQDLADEIIEKEKIEKKQKINWENAADPTMDLEQRYLARLAVNISPKDYPARARRAGLGRVVVGVTLYITAAGKIRDVRIRKIRSDGGAADIFEKDFRQAVRRILLKKTKLVSPPYARGGRAVDFSWDTTVTFMLN